MKALTEYNNNEEGYREISEQIEVKSKDSLHLHTDSKKSQHWNSFLSDLSDSGEVCVLLPMAQNYRGKALKEIIFKLGEEDEYSFRSNKLQLVFSKDTLDYVEWSFQDASQRNGFRTPELASFGSVKKKDAELVLYGMWL